MAIVHSSQNFILKYCTKCPLFLELLPPPSHLLSMWTALSSMSSQRPGLTLRQVSQHREPGFMDLCTPGLWHWFPLLACLVPIGPKSPSAKISLNSALRLSNESTCLACGKLRDWSPGPHAYTHAHISQVRSGPILLGVRTQGVQSLMPAETRVHTPRGYEAKGL